MRPDSEFETIDVALIGSGVMSANLGALLKCLDPNLKIELYEVTDQLSQESSNGWNNAGTGHAGICELSYTPDRGTGWRGRGVQSGGNIRTLRTDQTILGLRRAHWHDR